MCFQSHYTASKVFFSSSIFMLAHIAHKAKPVYKIAFTTVTFFFSFQVKNCLNMNKTQFSKFCGAPALRNPLEQPCQPLENPVHPSSFTWVNPVCSPVDRAVLRRLMFILPLSTLFKSPAFAREVQQKHCHMAKCSRKLSFHIMLVFSEVYP